MIGIPGPPLLSSTMQSNTAGRQQFTPSPSPGSSSSPPSKPNYNAFQSTSAPTSSNKPNAFAMLGNLASQPSPQPSQQPLQQLQQLKQQPQQIPQLQIGGDTDEWADFASALPPASNPPPLKANEILVLSSNLHIIAEASRELGQPDGAILLKTRFSNATAHPIYELTFQMAAPRVRIPVSFPSQSPVLSLYLLNFSYLSCSYALFFSMALFASAKPKAATRT